MGRLSFFISEWHFNLLINMFIYVNTQDNLGLPWEGVKINLGEGRVEGRE